MITYGDSNCGVTNTNVIDRPCSVEVEDGSSSVVASTTYTYDADGNSTWDTVNSYSWDADGNMIKAVTSSATTNVTYDAMDRAVEFQVGSSYTQIVYGPAGGKLALMSGQTLSKAFVPLAGGAVAVYSSTGLAYYRHSDWLGSSRLASTPSRGIYYDGAYAPYGENYAESGTTDRSFTGQDQDMVSSGSYPLYDFLMREYHPTWGRWISPDPAGLAAANPANPQTWNRYAYALNNPTTLTDPLGLFRAGPCLEDPFAPGCNGGGGSDYIAPGTCAEILIDGFDTWQNTCGGRILIPNIPNIPNVASGNRPGRPPAPKPKPGNPQTLPQAQLTDKNGTPCNQKILGRFNSQFGTNVPLKQTVDIGAQGLGRVTDNILIPFPLGTLPAGVVQPGRFGGGPLGTGSTLHVVNFYVGSLPGSNLQYDIAQVHLDQGDPGVVPFGPLAHLDYVLTHSAGHCP